MNYLGTTGVRVSEICLGSMTFGRADAGCDAATSEAIMDEFVRLGKEMPATH